jgi:hypothetical protein
VQFVPSSQPSELVLRQGRLLAVVATVLVPALIAIIGFDKGYPLAVIGAALLIWSLGTGAWLGYSWRWLKPGRPPIR